MCCIYGGNIFMIKLVIVRHGESIWNYENIFTGCKDIDLSDNGIAEAKQAGKNRIAYLQRRGCSASTKWKAREAGEASTAKKDKQDG